MTKIQFKGKQMTLKGKDLKIGDKVSDFRVLSKDMQETSLSEFGDKIKIITTFPSLDTPVCDLQVKQFNKLATELSENVAILALSVDLPFAQKRFCDAYSIDKLFLGSDYRNNEAGLGLGILIEELKLLARSVFILDGKNILRYKQVVEDIGAAPDYVKALAALKEITG